MSLLQALNLPVPASLAAAAAPNKPADAKAAGTQAAAPAAKAGKQLLEAAEVWRQTRGQAEARIAALKAAVKAHCADSPPPLVQAVDKGLLKLDGVMKTVDQRLAESLAAAGNAGDDAGRKSELEKAKAIVAEYIGYLKGEPLVALMDRNPFGTKTDLQSLLGAGLTKAAKAIG